MVFILSRKQRSSIEMTGGRDESDERFDVTIGEHQRKPTREL